MIAGPPGWVALVALAFGADSDRDGLDDAAETRIGTDPLVPDTDADRFSDGGEVHVLGTDPLDPDGSCDLPLRLVSRGTAHADLWPADLDRDGDADLLDATREGGVLAAWENLGAGRFSANPRVVVPVGATLVRAGDLDGDGLDDAIYGTEGYVWTAPNLGGWTFGPPTRIGESIMGPNSLDLADMDADGDLDVLVSQPDLAGWGFAVFWIDNRGDGSFRSPRTIAAIPVTHTAVGDVDGDALPDVVATNLRNVVWLQNLGAGTFSGPKDVVRDVSEPRVPMVVDIDGDGRNDLLWSTGAAGMVAWNRGGGAFAVEPIPSDATAHDELWPADLDEDGDLDLLLAEEGHRIAWSECVGPRRLAPSAVLREGVDTWSLIAADLDGDGAVDPAFTGTVSGATALAWLVNAVGDPDADLLPSRDEICFTGSAPDHPDTDLGGVVDGVELAIGRDPLAPADDGDADGDGSPDLLDCDDGDSDRHPEAPEVCGNAADEDCNDLVDEDCLVLDPPVPGQAGGTNTSRVTGAEPGARLTLVMGLSSGTSPFPGECPGQTIDLDRPRPLGTETANGAGTADIAFDVPPGGAGRTFWFQAADPERCEVSPALPFAFPP